MLNPELIKAARRQLETLNKRSFVPMDQTGVVQQDPNVQQGMPAPAAPPPAGPAGPADATAAPAPPQDPSAGPPPGQPVMVSLDDLMQLFQAVSSGGMGGGAPQAAPAGAPALAAGGAGGGEGKQQGAGGKGGGKADINAQIAVMASDLKDLKQLLMSILAPASSPMPPPTGGEVPPGAMGAPMEEGAPMPPPEAAPPMPPPEAGPPKTAAASRARLLSDVIRRLQA